MTNVEIAVNCCEALAATPTSHQTKLYRYYMVNLQDSVYLRACVFCCSFESFFFA